ncbi:MAG: hypothetical protein QM791_19315 [Ferruginibacter sp.]
MTALVSLSVWIFAILINTVITTAFLGLQGEGGSGLLEITGIILLFSSIFSFPGILLFWLVFLFNCKRTDVFSILLVTAIAVSVLSIVVFALLVNDALGAGYLLILLFPIIAALASVMLHHPAIDEVMRKQVDLKKMIIA